MKLKLYTETEGIPEAFFLPIIKYPDHFHFVESIEEAQYVVIPIYWEVIYNYTSQEFKNAGFNEGNLEELKISVYRIIEKANKAEKPLIVFFYRDSLEDLPVKNAYVFRTSLLKSRQKEFVFALPANKGDVLKESGLSFEKTLLRKTEKPTVGFRGSAAAFELPFISSVKEFINSWALRFSIPIKLSTGWEEGYMFRRNSMICLQKNSKIKVDFSILYDGAETSKIHHSLNRKLFIDNIMNNQYNLCVKGWGNYSYRFYETLSAGKIPIFVNTDCTLPYDFIIDWKKYCVWVESKDIFKIDQILLDFHNSLNDHEFIQLQKDIRKLWEEWIDTEGFLKNFYKHFIHTKAIQVI